MSLSFRNERENNGKGTLRLKNILNSIFSSIPLILQFPNYFLGGYRLNFITQVTNLLSYIDWSENSTARLKWLHVTLSKVPAEVADIRFTAEVYLLNLKVYYTK